jgi:hypothetical protein
VQWFERAATGGVADAYISLAEVSVARTSGAARSGGAAAKSSEWLQMGAKLNHPSVQACAL